MAVLFIVIAGIVVLGNLFPRKVSFLPGMRYYAGNWDTTQWCVTSRSLSALRTLTVARSTRWYTASWLDTTRKAKTCDLCSMVLGWNLGNGHMDNECLMEALQERCGLEAGDVRVVILDAQPIRKQRPVHVDRGV